LPLRSPLSPDAARLIALDKQINRQLQATKDVRGLLLKHEEEDLVQVTARARELLQKYSVPYKTQPCQGEAQVCAECFKKHPKEAWRCAQVAEAYRVCSTAAFSGRSHATAAATQAAAARG
ncbi:hypothetical protein VOLCADRAFT_117578, partial [Volvox carteri f. nagariensis]